MWYFLNLQVSNNSRENCPYPSFQEKQKTKVVLFSYFLAKKPSPMGIQTKALIKWYQITQLIK